MATKVQNKTVSSWTPPFPQFGTYSIGPLEKEALATMSEMPLWQEVDHEVLVAASKAIRRVMKNHGTALTPPQTGMLAQLWVFDAAKMREILEAKNSVPAVMKS